MLFFFYSLIFRLVHFLESGTANKNTFSGTHWIVRKAEIGEEATSLKLVSETLPQTPAKGARLKTLFTGVCHADLNFTDNSGIFERPGK